jgi:prevent-host-death family protein
VRQAALAEVKDDLSRFLRLAKSGEILITRHGKPAGVLIGFASEDDWFDYRIENDPRFLNRIAAARASLRAGQGIRLEELIREASNKRLHADRGHRAISKERPKRVSGGRRTKRRSALTLFG